MMSVAPEGPPATQPPALAIATFGPMLPQLERYVQWLRTAGVERGLLGPREVDRLWDRHILNSAALLDWLPADGTVLDLGSGAGLPGLVLAMRRPDLQFLLLEPQLRRSTFLAEVVADLEVGNVSVVRERAADFARQRPAAADAVVARAVAPLDRLAGWAVPLLRPAGSLLALKGEKVAGELAAAGPTLDRLGIATREVHQVTMGATVTHVVVLVRGRDGTEARRKAR